MYRKSDGTSPVQEFIASLDDKMQAKVIRAIDMLEQRGSQLRVPISKELDEGIFELRISLAGNATRILYFFVRQYGSTDQRVHQENNEDTSI